MYKVFVLFGVLFLFVACATENELSSPVADLSIDEKVRSTGDSLTDEGNVNGAVSSKESVKKAEESLGKIVPSLGENRLSEIPQSCLDLPENKDLVTKPFQIVGEYGEGAGQATLYGTVSSRREEIWGETVERVYFAVQEPAIESTGLKFYNYFKDMVDSGNTVNLGSKAETAIGFALGIIDKDGKFSSTAGVSDGAEKSIMNALNQGETISLTLSVPKYEGSGAPVNFSFACMIEL